MSGSLPKRAASRDSVIGTINVESPSLNAFTHRDQQFLEIFARDVAVALNTLELLVAQRTNAAKQSCEAIHAAVALPIDDLLLDAVHLMEKYISIVAGIVFDVVLCKNSAHRYVEG